MVTAQLRQASGWHGVVTREAGSVDVAHHVHAEVLQHTRVLLVAPSTRSLHGDDGHVAAHREQQLEDGERAHGARIAVGLGQDHVHPQHTVRVHARRSEVSVHCLVW